MEEEHEMSTLRERRYKKFSGGISSCFNISSHRRGASFDGSSSPWSPCTWIKSKTSDHLTSPDHDKATPSKSRNFISQIARRRRHASADFSYDPLSYSLNFEESPWDEDEFLHNNFIARLPASPPRHFNHRHPSRKLPRSETGFVETPKSVSTDGNHELIRGFEALSTRIEKRKTKKEELSSPRAAAVAEVRRSLELHEVPSSTVRISSNREILVDVNSELKDCFWIQ